MEFPSYFDTAMRNETNTKNWYQHWVHCTDKADHEVLSLCKWLLGGVWKSQDIKLEKHYNTMNRENGIFWKELGRLSKTRLNLKKKIRQRNPCL